MSHTYELCHTHMSYVTHIWVMSHTYELCHTHMSETFHTHMNASSHTHMNESFHTHKWVMSHTSRTSIRLLIFTPAQHGSTHAHIRGIAVFWRHFLEIPHCVTWLIHVWDMTHICAGRDSFICGTSSLMCVTTSLKFYIVGHDSFMGGTWLIHGWDMTHSCVRHDPFISGTSSFVRSNTCLGLHTLYCGTWLIHGCDMTHSWVRHDSFMGGARLIHGWDMTHSCVKLVHWCMAPPPWDSLGFLGIPYCGTRPIEVLDLLYSCVCRDIAYSCVCRDIAYSCVLRGLRMRSVLIIRSSRGIWRLADLTNEWVTC